MRVAIIGLGAIGRVLTGALSGRADVVGVDRTSAPLREGEPRVDVAIVATKTPGTRWAADIVKRILSPDGAVVTVQNGLGNREVLGDAVGLERAVSAALYVGAYVEDDRLFVTGTAPRLEVSRPSHAGAARRIDDLAVLLRQAGWEIYVVADAAPLVWRKVVVNAAINPVSAILDIENGRLPGHAAGALVADALATEAARVATAAGVPISDSEAHAMWRAAAERTATNRSSMLEDVRAGRETEIEAIAGEITRHAKRLSVPAGLNEVMVELISSLR